MSKTHVFTEIELNWLKETWNKFYELNSTTIYIECYGWDKLDDDYCLINETDHVAWQTFIHARYLYDPSTPRNELNYDWVIDNASLEWRELGYIE